MKITIEFFNLLKINLWVGVTIRVYIEIPYDKEQSRDEQIDELLVKFTYVYVVTLLFAFLLCVSLFEKH